MKGEAAGRGELDVGRMVDASSHFGIFLGGVRHGGGIVFDTISGVVVDDISDETRLTTLLLLNTMAAASSHVGIVGILFGGDRHGGVGGVEVAVVSAVIVGAVGNQNLSIPAPTHLPVLIDFEFVLLGVALLYF